MIAQVAHEHVPRRVRQQQRRARLHRHRLRRYGACPEGEHLARAQLHRIAKVRLVDVADADGRRSSGVDRRAMRQWHVRTDGRCLLDDMGFAFVRDTNAQYIIRNMGGDSIKCDRWICELLRYLGITACTLEAELADLDISQSLFDVVVWAYCERFVKRVAGFKDHCDLLLAASEC